jgi:voltage-gated potassium channel
MNSRRKWWLAILLTMALPTLLVAAEAGKIGPLAMVLLGVLAAAVGIFFWQVPQTPFLSVVFGNLLALYMGLFSLLAESNFDDVSAWALLVGYSLPVACFLLGSLLYKRDIARMVDNAGLNRMGEGSIPVAWLVPIAALVLSSFYAERLPPDLLSPDWVFLSMMGVTAIVVLVMARQVCAFIVYTGQVFEGFFHRLRALAVPAFVFLTLYSVLVMVFGGVYRLASYLSPEALFVVAGEPRTLEFGEALYFSIVTLSTVGYGDIAPLTTEMRLLVSVQIVMGVLLMLFGVAEIIGHAKRRPGRASRQG